MSTPASDCPSTWRGIRSKRVIEALPRLVSIHGTPLFMRSDNGPDFFSFASLYWIAQADIAVLYDLGKP